MGPPTAVGRRTIMSACGGRMAGWVAFAKGAFPGSPANWRSGPLAVLPGVDETGPKAVIAARCIRPGGALSQCVKDPFVPRLRSANPPSNLSLAPRGTESVQTAAAATRLIAVPPRVASNRQR